MAFRVKYIYIVDDKNLLETTNIYSCFWSLTAEYHIISHLARSH